MPGGQLKRIPLFPLPNVVLFPGARVPLHIFEPRYRQMLQAALEGDRVLGMVTVRPDHRERMQGNPPVHPLGCAGFITDHHRLADGRYDLLLLGTQRFRIHGEYEPTSTRLYRLADVELLEESDDAGDPQRVDRVRREVVAMVGQLARHASGEDALEIPVEGLAELDTLTFTSVLCSAIGLETVEKQGLLEANGASARLGQLAELLRFHLSAIENSAGEAPPTLH